MLFRHKGLSLLVRSSLPANSLFMGVQARGITAMQAAQKDDKRFIKPSTPTPSHLQKFKLSPIDLLLGPWYGPVIFYYHANGGPESVPAKIRRLEESLSKTLTLFHPLAGRHGEEGDDSVIECRDQGVELSEARVDGKLDELLLGDGGASFSEMLLPLPKVSFGGSDLPIVAVKVSVFECGGIAIGVKLNHIVGDFMSVCMFLDAWATASREGIENVVVRPSFFGSLFRPVEAVKLPPSPFPNEEETKLVLKRFVFSGEAISRLRDEATAVEPSENGNNPDRKRISRVELVTALICKVSMKLDRAKYGKPRPFGMVHAINLRGKTELQLADSLFGNVFADTPSTLLEHMTESASESLGTFLPWVNDTLRNAVADFAQVKDLDELCCKVTAAKKKMDELLMDENIGSMVFSNWRYPFYKLDFGWGSPSLVGTAKSFDNVTILIGTKSGDGIEAWVTLQSDTMHRFERDADILKYTCQPQTITTNT